MPYGLRCWDEYRNVTLDITDRICKRLGRATFEIPVARGVSLATINSTMTFSLPAEIVGSNLAVWIHPTENIIPNWDGIRIDSFTLTGSVSGSTLTAKFDMTGYSNFAGTIKFVFEYGVY